VVPSVNSKVIPVATATPSTIPEFETVALLGSLEVQVPPDIGVTVMFPPTQTDAGVVTTGNAFTVIGSEFVKQPVVGLVLIRKVVPALTPDTTPVVGVTVKTAVLLLVHVNPVPPVNTIVEPTQTPDRPLTTGFGFTVIIDDVFAQPVVELVNMNDVVPKATPFTTPDGEIVAINGFPPDQTPAVEAVRLMLAPTQTCVDPLRTGKALITTFEVVSEQLEEVSKNLKVTFPGFEGTAGVIIPDVLPTVATLVTKDVQVPPEDGDNEPVLPTQTDEGEVRTG